jgi:hypothetical protein
MRSISPEEIARFSPKIVSKAILEPKKDDPLVKAINAFPRQLVAAIAMMPAPVIAPRPPGTWIIDVNRDKEGKMNQMVAKFHETKNT